MLELPVAMKVAPISRSGMTFELEPEELESWSIDDFGDLLQSRRDVAEEVDSWQRVRCR